MRKFLSLLFALLLCASAGLAQTVQNRWPLYVGVNCYTTPQQSTVNLNAADTWAGFAFFPSAAKTVAKVRVYAGYMTGSVTSMQADIYSDSSGSPDASLSHITYTPGGNIPVGVVEFAGFTQAVASHTPYWAVISNLSGTPASNHPRIDYIIGMPLYTSTVVWGWLYKKATTGPAWGGASINVGGVEIEYSDGSVDGWLVNNAPNSSIKIYDSGSAHSELAASFTTPANTSLKVRGIGFTANRVLSPPSGLKFALYASSGHTALGTTGTIPAVNVSLTTSGAQYAYFPSTLTLSAGTTYKVSAIYDGTDGDTSNYYRVATLVIANNAVTKALGPLGGTISRTYWDGTVWDTLLTTEIPIFVLILDTDGPFPTVAGGGGTGRVVSQ